MMRSEVFFWNSSLYEKHLIFFSLIHIAWKPRLILSAIVMHPDSIFVTGISCNGVQLEKSANILHHNKTSLFILSNYSNVYNIKQLSSYQAQDNSMLLYNGAGPLVFVSCMNLAFKCKALFIPWLNIFPNSIQLSKNCDDYSL